MRRVTHAAAVAALVLASGAGAAPEPSRSLGLPWDGRLANGVALPAESDAHFTWDYVRERVPNREWRRHGGERLVRTLLRVTAEHRAAFPDAPRVGIGDLSRPRGGDFGPRFGPPGHVSHQNGLDADVYYPRRDGLERPPKRVRQIDRRLAQDLVDRFVAAGAAKVFVGPSTGLDGPPAIVEELPAYHDNHLHVRLPGDGVRTASVGTSTRGQPIRAFALGRGPVRVLVIGCIHGDECAGSVVATRLLHSAPPARGSVWVVPDLNPDGHAAETRHNARGVDLNRNFPGSWRRLAVSGSAPGSELETQVAMRLIRRLRPEVTIWFHQPQGLVRATGASVAVARRYARLAGMRFRALPRPPGSATEWQHRALPGTRAFVVELPPGELGLRAAAPHARAVLALAADARTPAGRAPKRLDAARPVRMAPLAGSVQNPCFSPTGDRLVVTQWLDGYNGEGDPDDIDYAHVLVVSRASGQVLARLSEERTTSVNLPGSCWSRGTDRITYSAAIEGPDHIFTIDGDGGRRTQLTNEPARALYEPSFSPDGAWVVFESHPYDVEAGGELWKVRADGSGLTRLTRGRDDRQPNWSPRGDLIVFQRKTGPTWDLWTMRPDGSGLRNVTRSRAIDETDVSWSPSGRWLVYSHGGPGIDIASLFTIGADGRGRKQLTRTRGWYDGAPSWSYDGRTIAFESRAGEPDGSSGTRVYSIPAPAGRR